MVSLESVLKWFDLLAKEYEANKELLTELDSAIGDADHGINMLRGFTAVAREEREKNPENLSAAMKLASMTLIKNVGGASGPLYGTLFLKMATMPAENSIALAEFVKFLELGVEGVAKMGKSTKGEKTMLDVWYPVVDAMKAAITLNKSDADVWSVAVLTAEKSLELTKPMLATKGRASFLGERSIGHQDPGATSSLIMIKAASEVFA